MAWVRQQGIDATGIKAQGGELRFIERVLAVVDKASWESVTQQQVRDALAEIVELRTKPLSAIPYMPSEPAKAVWACCKL